MGAKKFPRLLVLIFLLCLTLACSLVTWEEVKPELNLPTPAPTMAPTEAPTEPLALVPATEEPPTRPASPQVFNVSARSTAYAGSGDNNASCSSQARVTLVVSSDGQAHLTATGPQFFDHINCTATSAEITWLLDGTANLTESQADFNTCNSGGLGASGSVSFRDGVLSGEVSCITKDGKLAVTLMLGQ